MVDFLKTILIKLSALINCYPTRATDKKAIEVFIKSLRPITTDKELIRLGPDKDGGYLVPNDFKGIEACFSPGVNTVCAFEKCCAEMGIKVFMADKSIDSLPDSHELFNFSKKYIGAINDNDFITLDDWLAATLCQSNSDLMLQMDVEGYEYETILSMSDILLKRFRIMIVEFHSMHMIFSMPFFALVSRVFEKLLQNHSIVHIHPNAIGFIASKYGFDIPNYLEITLLRNDRINNKVFTRSFPHPLDYDNDKHHQLTLPDCFYKY